MHDYGTQRALHGLSCGIERGSVTALVGPNGAGKTTLMMSIAGILAPLRGSIRLFGGHGRLRQVQHDLIDQRRLIRELVRMG